MNAQELINETPVDNFDFSVFWKLQSLMNSERMTRGDKVQECHTESNTILSLESLGPFNYSKLNEARLNLQVQKDFKDLGIEIL